MMKFVRLFQFFQFFGIIIDIGAKKFFKSLKRILDVIFFQFWRCLKLILYPSDFFITWDEIVVNVIVDNNNNDNENVSINNQSIRDE